MSQKLPLKLQCSWVWSRTINERSETDTLQDIQENITISVKIKVDGLDHTLAMRTVVKKNVNLIYSGHALCLALSIS